MTTRFAVLFLTVWLSTAFGAICGAQETTLELSDGDQVVFLGNSFFERALEYGHIETALRLCNASRDIQFRNIGWDGDTVFGHSRAGGRRRAVFGDANEGFDRMTKHVLSLEPTVVFVAYGFNESFDGEEGLEAFDRGLQKLLRTLNGPKRRFVLLSPPPVHEQSGTEPGYVAQRNEMLRTYSLAIEGIAKSKGYHFIDLFAATQNTDVASSDNGIHLNDEGYRAAAETIVSKLSQPRPKWEFNSPEAESLRQAIVKKNTLYFHRWRPRNDAFVYGERKDEQKIAQAEPEQFEPFIAKQESLIRQLLKGGKQ